MKKRRIALLTALAVLVVGTLSWVVYAGWLRPTPFEKATSLLPAQTLRVTWTDWAGVRAELGGSPSYDEVVDRDLTTSSLASSSAQLKQTLGFSPMAADWELMGQSRDGLVVILHFPDIAAIADGFADAGYTRPGSKALDGAIWSGSSELVNNLGLTTFELTHVAFFEDEGLLVATDKQPYLKTAVAVARGDKDGLSLDGLLTPPGDPLVATAFTGDYACEALSMAQADEGARKVTDELLGAAGGAIPLKGYLVSLGPDQAMSVVFAFENDKQAERQRRVRAALAKAEDPGQGIAYPDSFALTADETDGNHVVLTARAEQDGYPLSNLTSGPVLLASC